MAPKRARRKPSANASGMVHDVRVVLVKLATAPQHAHARILDSDRQQKIARERWTSTRPSRFAWEWAWFGRARGPAFRYLEPEAFSPCQKEISEKALPQKSSRGSPGHHPD